MSEVNKTNSCVCELGQSFKKGRVLTVCLPAPLSLPSSLPFSGQTGWQHHIPRSLKHPFCGPPEHLHLDLQSHRPVSPPPSLTFTGTPGPPAGNLICWQKMSTSGPIPDLPDQILEERQRISFKHAPPGFYHPLRSEAYSLLAV